MPKLGHRVPGTVGSQGARHGVPWNRYFDLSGEARQQLEALVDACCLEVVALGMSCRLRAEVLLRKDAVEYGIMGSVLLILFAGTLVRRYTGSFA